MFIVVTFSPDLIDDDNNNNNNNNALNVYFGVHRFDLSRKFSCPNYRFSWFSSVMQLNSG